MKKSLIFISLLLISNFVMAQPVDPTDKTGFVLEPANLVIGLVVGAIIGYLLGKNMNSKS